MVGSFSKFPDFNSVNDSRIMHSIQFWRLPYVFTLHVVEISDDESDDSIMSDVIDVNRDILDITDDDDIMEDGPDTSDSSDDDTNDDIDMEFRAESLHDNDKGDNNHILQCAKCRAIYYEIFPNDLF